MDMMAWACAFSLLMFFFMFVVKVSLQFTTAISTTSSRSDASAWGTDRGSGGESSPARWHPSVKGIPRIYREIGYSVECSLEVFPRTSFVASFADGVICLHLYSHNPHWNPYRFCIRDSFFFTLIARVERFLLFQILAIQLVLLLDVVPFPLTSELVNGTLRFHRVNGGSYFHVIHFKSNRE